MPRAQLTDTYVSGDAVDQFDYLKLENTGDMARVLIPENEGYWEYVHTMRAPVIGDDDLPVIIVKTRKDKSTYPDYNMGFVGQRICYGDHLVIEDKGMDPDRCPACSSAKRGYKDMAPERRFAIPVIKYATTRRTSTELQDPPGATILVWKLGQKLYNTLMKDARQEIRNLMEIPADQEVPLRAADIVLLCEDGGFQRIAFKAPMRPAYRSNPELSALIRKLWANEANRPTDEQLKAACGRAGGPADRGYMVIDVERVEERWDKAERAGKDSSKWAELPATNGHVAGATPDLEKDLTDLLEDHPGGLEEFAPKTATTTIDDPFGDGPAQPAASAPAATVAEDPFGDPVAPVVAAPAPAAPAEVDPFAEHAAAVAAPAAAAAPVPVGVASFDDIIDS
jgi:hypothetical protein